jgi:glycosyltransferase involved in cell wall biosynthesis
MQHATIDIVLATYNGEKFLDELIHSILNQTYPHIRLIIRDDCSTDSTLSIVNKWIHKDPNRVYLVPSSTKLGVIKNFSTLLEHTTHEYIMLADQDDSWLSHKVAKTFEKMQDLEKLHGKKMAVLVHTDLFLTDQCLNIFSHSFWDHLKFNPTYSSRLNRLLVQNMIAGCTIMMNRSLKDLATPIPDEAMMHDWWLGLVAATFGKVGIIHEPTILYRQHQSNTSGGFFKPFKISHYLHNRLLGLNPTNKVSEKIKTQNNDQAFIFLMRFHNRLSRKEKQMLFDYSQLHQLFSLKRRYLMIKHRFFYSGTIHNLVVIFVPPLYLRTYVPLYLRTYFSEFKKFLKKCKVFFLNLVKHA